MGQAEDRLARTGVTVVLPDEPARAAVDMRGGAPGTRETDALDPMSLAGRIDAVVLSGGSAFGLDSASGVMAWLSEQGRGFELRADLPRVPIVPAAILFDLASGGRFSPEIFPGLGRKAVATASAEFSLGNAGAGYGALRGRLQGRDRKRLGGDRRRGDRGRAGGGERGRVSAHSGYGCFLGVRARTGRRVRRQAAG